MSCGIDDTLKLCIVPSDEEQLLGSAELQEGEANPARVNEAAGGDFFATPMKSPPTKEIASACISADATTGLRSIPSDALHNLLLYCGPQSVTTGLGSTSKHYRSSCLTSGDSDAVWKIFFKWRCSSKLVLGNTSRPTSVRSVADHPEEQSDEIMPSRDTAERRREFQSSARLSPWNASSKSFENGRLSPDEPYYSIYRRLHLEGKSRENNSGVRCNRSRALSVVPQFATANPIAAVDDDPTLQEIETGGLLEELALFTAGIDPIGAGRLCNSDAEEWCDAPSCRRARCRKCLGSQYLGARGSALPNQLSASYIGSIAAKCDYCAISLCKGTGGCAENNLRHCDSCNRGVCLDCENIVSNDPLGVVRTCKGQRGRRICGQYICWRCARTVGRSKLVEIVPKNTDIEGNIPYFSLDNIDEESKKMSPSDAIVMHDGSKDHNPRRSPVNMSSNSKFEALPFASEKQFADATGQTLCEGCAKEKVGKLNMYRRLDMSPRI